MDGLQNKSQKTPWGYELVWASTESYGGKMLVFTNAGNKTPFGFTKKQDRTWFVNNGSVKIRWIDTTKGQLYEASLTEGQTYHVPQFQPVSLEAVSDNTGTFTDDVCVILKSESIS
jgi:hypothetical protein